ncbi:hypothetical protein IW140_003752 [Coemansia sp. RSA 1813]|nr:hypothetical protein EV178_003534 [Coemansia sp. RSA 1646]KAJ1772781.1 hypothetical protein LPJ74_001120 [Coemansia sp. RSA 1843]KAJ2088646.1 hypothetical protein IW138_004028 [Coemansia sp. RSA 986]KAJ2213148.1 hypothetical protein EV179_004118 [Coemansia sp. RSA 487]KAJ2568546.1 hypothetical protein IW140_003752 [Coemansia sp. RSA 1813]
MQAIQLEHIGGPEVLHVVETPLPTAKAGEIVVRNKYAGVNFIDTYYRSGVYPTQLPTLLGQEGAGEVVAIGDGVETVSVGNSVAYLGSQNTYAQYTVVDATQAMQFDSDVVSYETAAASLLQGLTAHTLITRSYEVKPNDWVLVQAGAGGTGRILAQMCKLAGANVISTVSSKQKAEVAKQAGADYTILYTEESVSEAVRRIIPDGVHVVYDGVGKSTFEGSIASLRRTGTMVSFGNASGTVPPVNLLSLGKDNIVLLRPRLYGYIVTSEERNRHFGALAELIAKKKLDFQIFKIYELKDAAQAHIDLQSRKTTGKLLLRIP